MFYNTVADPDPNATVGGQLPNPNQCNSARTSETRGETLTPNPNECNSTLTSGTRWRHSPHLYHINWGGGQIPNPNECNSMLTSETRGETLNPDECHSTRKRVIRGIYPCLYLYLYIDSLGIEYDFSTAPVWTFHNSNLLFRVVSEPLFNKQWWERGCCNSAILAQGLTFSFSSFAFKSSASFSLLSKACTRSLLQVRELQGTLAWNNLLF